jgi:hypothetical protein
MISYGDIFSQKVARFTFFRLRYKRSVFKVFYD